MISFQPECTFPTTTPSGFVNGPDLRSTMEIVWSCASAIILSTWSVLHLNLPPDLEATSRAERVRKYCYLLQRKLGCMGIMLAFPEYFVGMSITNLFSAWVNHPFLVKFAEEDGVPWSLTHTILANMGGFALRFSGARDVEDEKWSVAGPGQQNSFGTMSVPGHVSNGEQIAEEKSLRDHSGAPVTLEIGKSRGGSAPEPPGKPSICRLEVGIQIPQTPTYVHGRYTSHHSSEKNPSVVEGDIPAFIQKFQDSQTNHLSGFGEIPWRPLRPHIALATHASPSTVWMEKNCSKYRAEHAAPLSGNIWILDSKQLHIARSRGIISKLPCLSREVINDKSKSDGLVRLLAVSQLFWLAVQLIARKIEQHSCSALEISTVAFSACAIIIYVAEWAKPKDVEVPFYVETQKIVSSETFTTVAEAGPITFLQPRYYYIAQSCIHQVIEGRFEKRDVDRIMVLMTILSITLYGGIHLFAWDIHFPTHVEKLLWRISALTVAIAPTISALLVFLEDLCRHRTDKFSQCSVAVLAPAYLAARLYIIVESFRALYYLPRSAFIATWVVNSPHVG